MKPNLRPDGTQASSSEELPPPPRLFCQVCKQDHRDMNRKWCDRSDLELKYDALLKITQEQEARFERLKAEKEEIVRAGQALREENEKLKAECNKWIARTSVLETIEEAKLLELQRQHIKAAQDERDRYKEENEKLKRLLNEK